MKLILLAAMTALVNAQAPVAAKPAPAEPIKQQSAPMRRKFTPEEIEKLSLYTAQLQVIRDRNKAEELEKAYQNYQQEVAPIAAKQKALIKAACVQVGVPEDKTESGECGATFGFDPSGKPINGQDGKPIESEVWHVVPKQPVPFNPTSTK